MDLPRFTLAHDLCVREVARLEKAAHNVSSDTFLKKDQPEGIEIFKFSLKVVLGHLVKFHGHCVRLFCCIRIRWRYCACAVRVGSGG